MESTRPIRALLRGLDALSALNSRDGAIVSELVSEIRLPRTTVYRLLETLCEAGFVRSCNLARRSVLQLLRGSQCPRRPYLPKRKLHLAQKRISRACPKEGGHQLL